MRFLFVALSTKGLGETIMGVQLAKRLIDKGHECLFVVHESAVGVLAETGIPHRKVADHVIQLTPLFLRAAIDRFDPTHVVLSDYFTTMLALQRSCADLDCVTTHGRPVIAIDTWDMQRSGTVIDVFHRGERRIEDWTDALDARLVPVPIAGAEGESRYSCLPAPIAPTAKIRRHVRRDLGVEDGGRMVLICTAKWQHSRYRSRSALRLARNVPRLLAAYLDRVGGPTRLVHIGPQPFELNDDARYLWLPAMRPERFDVVLGSADLLLTLNASSTSIFKALVSEVPVLALRNSHRLNPRSRGALEDPAARDWLSETGSIYPFSMWPLGYHRFLAPVIDGGEYARAIHLSELLDGSSVTDRLRALLLDEDERSRALERQEEYARTAASLPEPDELLQEAPC